MALTQEKKRRQRGKRLNLLGEEEAGVAQFFSPQRILTAKAYQEGKEEAIEEEKRQKALRKEEATAKREELHAQKEERRIQRQLYQEANSEQKAAKKAQKALDREERRLQKEQKDQEKALSTIQRQKERERLKQLTVATQIVGMQKTPKRRASKGPSVTFKKPINPLSRAIRATKGSLATPPRLNIADSSSIAGASDLTAVEARNTNRRGRIVALPQRFRE
jgi:hypothetical protein